MKAPSPPNPYQTASAQQRAETGAAGASSVMNNPNIVTPYGSQSYSISGWEQVPDANGKMISVPRYTQTQSLSPDQQKLMGLNTQTQYNLGQTAVQQSSKMQDYLNKSINTKGWQAWNKGPGMQDIRQDKGPTDRAGIERAMMQNYTQDTQGQNAAQDAQMAARGMAPGSSQYGSMDQQRMQARGRAVNDAYLASGNEARQAQQAYNTAAGQKFDMGGAIADRQNALRGMQSGEAFALRNQPINEIMALMGGSQVTMPQFSPYQGQGINSANIAGMIGQNYAQQNAAAANFNQGAFSLAGAGAGALGAWAGSDRRLKRDIQRVEGDLAGAPLYSFHYRSDPDVLFVGVMSDDVRALHPDAVREVDGYDQVNYGLLAARHEGAPT